MKPAKKYQTLRGLWTDTRDGTVYNGSLRAAMLRAGFTVPEYNRSVRALRGLGGWPARVTIRPAHVTEVADAKRTLTWEVEAVFTNRNDVGAVEELVLGNGGWLRRIEVEARRSKHSRSKAYTYRALWLISGLVSV